jgi:hypothetical protein
MCGSVSGTIGTLKAEVATLAAERDEAVATLIKIRDSKASAEQLRNYAKLTLKEIGACDE